MMESCMLGVRENDANPVMAISYEGRVGGSNGGVMSDSTAEIDNNACVNSRNIADITAVMVRDVPDEIKPKVGMQFETEEHAYNFYNVYGKWCGFSVRKDQTRKLKTGEISRRIFRCSKAGVRDKKYFELENRKQRPRSITRCSCPASITLSLKPERNGYEISKFEETHNHNLQTPTKAHCLRSHRRVAEAQLKIVEDLRVHGIGVARSIDFLTAEAGGPCHLGCSERDIRNALRRKRQAAYGPDTNSLLNFFHMKSKNDPHFTYEIQIDEKSHFTSCFWVDGKSKLDYEAFNDVVCFDTTYKTNEYDMPFGPFVGVNHHMQTILLGAGLLYGETVEDFKWLFQTWLDAMGGVHPKTIMTDQDAAIGAAIAEVFPHSHHILCMWHINKKLPEKLSHIYQKYPTFKTTWNNCINGCKSIDDFELSWHNMLEEFNLRDNTWLQHMYSIRRMWIPAYTRNIFSAGMTTTGRSESLNAMLDGFVNHKSSLIDFANGYDRAVRRRRQEEVIADFESSNGTPVLKTKWDIEAEMANIYTLKVFLAFQKEVDKSMYYIATRYDLEDTIEKWRVHKFGEKDDRKKMLVRWCVDEEIAYCSCLSFEFRGIICKHIIALFRYKDIMNMPRKHTLDRWTRNAKKRASLAISSSSKELEDSPLLRSHLLTEQWSFIKNEAIRRMSAYVVVKEYLDKAKSALLQLPNDDIVDTLEGTNVGVESQPMVGAADNFMLITNGASVNRSSQHGTPSGTLATQSSQVCRILDPHVVQTKGRTNKRLKSAIEQPRVLGRMCRGCRQIVVGHDKRTCPSFREFMSTNNLHDEGEVARSRGRGRGKRGDI